MKKSRRILSIIIAALMVVTMLPLSVMPSSASAAADLTVTIDTGASVTLKDADGDGYYDIGTADELYAFAAAFNSGTEAVNGELTADIAVNKNVLTETGELNGDGSNFRVWIPIGNVDYKYTGVFDGGEHTVSGLYINDKSGKYIGLFSCVDSDSFVRNLGVIDSYINGKATAAGVAGLNWGTIENCYNTSTVISSDTTVGGIVGFNTGTVTACYNSGTITGSSSNVGGVVAYNYKTSGIVTGCYNTGSVSGKSQAGGIVGYNENDVMNCCNSGVVTGGWYTGGVVGNNLYAATITNCNNTATVNGQSYVGGVIGNNGSSTVTNCYNTGSVTGSSFYVGGVAGDNGSSSSIKNCYNTGSVTGNSYCVGGVAGDSSSTTVKNCYYLVGCATDGNNVTQYGIGNSTLGSTTANVSASTTGKSSTWFASDEVCSAIGYHSTSEATNGFCSRCYDAYQSANLNADGYYEIFNAGQLFWFAQQVNIEGNTTANAKLMADIDLENRTWYPIGVYNDAVNAGGTTAKVLFKGIFDGNGHTVSNFTATGTGSQGLVGYSDTTVVVKNLGVINATVSGWNAGAVLAYQGTVENCYAINCKVTGYTTATDAEGVFAGAVAGSQTPYAKYCFAYNCQVIAGTGMTATLAPVGGERVGNSYYSNVTAKNGTFRSHVGETAKTAEQFASGEVAYLLGTAWGQTIGTDSYPVPGGDKVYYGYTSCGDVDKVYTNDETVYETKPEHNFDSKGFCTECENGYQPAELKDGYYQIANAGQLFWFAKYINTVDRTASAVLTDDIDLENRPWSPIGFTSEKSNNFRGHFDGQGHTITGLYVEGDRAGLGFFGEVRTGTVENFTIYGEVVVNKEYNYVGGVIGSACGLNSSDHGLERNGATIRNITSYVNLTAGAHGIGMVGGFIGYANHETLIENCSWYGNFDAGIYRVDSGAGGFIGRIYDSASVTIRNCAAYGTITTEYKSGTFESKDDIYIGGFLSYSPSGAQTVMENNLWAGRIINNTNLSAENAHLSAYGTLTSFKSVTNCYMEEGSAAYITTSNVNTDGITTATAAQLKSGEVAYLLQGEQTEDIWGQIIGTDDYPVLGGEKVYYGYTFCGDTEMMYTNNTNTSAEKPAHTGGTATCTAQAQCEVCGESYGDLATDNHNFSDGCNGFCIDCDSYEPAVLNGDVYEISNAGQLYWFAEKVNSGDKGISGKLIENITVNANVLDANGELNNGDFRAWTPIGYYISSSDYKRYTGTFDGNGKTISGLYFNDSTTSYVGLFGYVYGGTVQNVGVINSYLHGNQSVGGIVGLNASGSYVMNCYNTGVVNGSSLIGGVVGRNGNGKVYNCCNTGSVSGSGNSVGGVAGYNDGVINNCYNTGNVSGSSEVGGVAGYNNSDDTVINSYNIGKVSGSGKIGSVVGNNNGTVKNCCYNSSFYSGNAIGAGEGTSTNVLAKTTEEFASGEVAYLLQGEQTEEVWGQTIGTDDYPVLGGAKVYQVTNCKDEAVYSNTNENIGHSYENGTCTVCGTTVFSLINGAAFDSTDSYIYGFAPGITSLDDYTEILVDGYEWTYQLGQFGGFGTGTKATLKNGEETVAEYIILIYGDLNGDGWYDADDAFLTNLIVAGLLTQENLPDYMWEAADCNHDGEINKTDVDLLMGAGVKLNDIDQNTALSELAAQSAYIEYMSIISQSAGLEVEDTAPETNETVEGTDFGIFLAQIFLFIRKILNFVLSLVI